MSPMISMIKGILIRVTLPHFSIQPLCRNGDTEELFFVVSMKVFLVSVKQQCTYLCFSLVKSTQQSFRL